MVDDTPPSSRSETTTWAPAGPGRREPPHGERPRAALESRPPRLIYERDREPSEDSPILYRERAYQVDALQTDQELAQHLLAELASIRDEWRERDSSQFVQLASFDHFFEEEPAFPPLATLSWKDWQGRPELWVRGVRRSGAPDSVEWSHPPRGNDAGLEAATDDGGFESDLDAFEAPTSTRGIALDANGGEAPPPSRVTLDLGRDALPTIPPASGGSDHIRLRNNDSGTSWQSPSRSGEFPIPQLDEEPAPPSSQRLLAGEELIGALFERIHELSYCPDVPAAAQYVLALLEEYIPCAGALVHLFDLDTRQFVLVRALGPHASALLASRSSGAGSPLEDALRRQQSVRVPGARQSLWARLGADVKQELCSPVQQGGRHLGAIEIGRGPDQGGFSDAELAALDYVCEQFAEYLAERPLDLDPESLRVSPAD
jgi:hypothetical protein